MLNFKPNFLKIYSATPYDFMLAILFRKNLLFSSIKILLKSFRVWDIENFKPFENFFGGLPPIHKNNFRKDVQFTKIIPQDHEKTKLFNIDTDRMDAPKWHSKP